MPLPREIETWRQDAYQQNIRHLAQQQGSKLRDAVNLETDLKGEKKFYNQIGSVEDQEITERHGDTPIMGTPSARRMITAGWHHWGDLIDDEDKVELIDDPTSEYVQAGTWAVGRRYDKKIVSAFDATAYVGEEGASTKSFPASHVIAADYDGDGTNEPLSVDKLTHARTIIMNDEIDLDLPMNEIHIACTPNQLETMLGLDKVISGDYNVKALQNGEINQFLGYRWHFISPKILPKSGDIRNVFVWCKSGMTLAVDPDIQTWVYRRGDKRQNVQVYLKARSGATRMEEEKVVKIKCDETK